MHTGWMGNALFVDGKCTLSGWRVHAECVGACLIMCAARPARDACSTAHPLLLATKSASASVGGTHCTAPPAWLPVFVPHSRLRSSRPDVSPLALLSRNTVEYGASASQGVLNVVGPVSLAAGAMQLSHTSTSTVTACTGVVKSWQP